MKRLSHRWQFSAAYGDEEHIPSATCRRWPTRRTPGSTLPTTRGVGSENRRRLSAAGRLHARSQLLEHQRHSVRPPGALHHRRHVDGPVAGGQRRRDWHVSNAGDQPAGPSRRKGVPAFRGSEVPRADERLQLAECQHGADRAATVGDDVQSADVDRAAATLRARRDLFVLATRWRRNGADRRRELFERASRDQARRKHTVNAVATWMLGIVARDGELQSRRARTEGAGLQEVV